MKTAYKNDEFVNREAKITSDEQTILTCLSKSLSLSQEEVKLINYSILPVVKYEVQTLIQDLRNISLLHQELLMTFHQDI